MSDKSPRRPSRRDFLTRGAAAAAVVGGIKAPAVASTADPLPALVHRRIEIVDWLNMNYAGYDDEPALYDELNTIEARLFEAVPTTGDGAMAQLRFLRRFLDEGFDFGDDCGRLVDNVIAGLARMGGAA